MQVFSKEWFKHNSNKLQWFANSWLGKKVLGLGPDAVVLNLGPHDVILLNQIATKNGYISCTFKQYTEPVFAKRLKTCLWPLWAGMHTVDSIILDHQSLVPDFGFATFTQDATDNTTPPYRSASYYYNASGVSFSTVRSSPANNLDYTGQVELYLESGDPGTTYERLTRITYGFDLSSFLTNAIYISDADLNIQQGGGGSLYSTIYTTAAYRKLALTKVDPTSKTSVNAEVADHQAGISTELATRQNEARSTFTTFAFYNAELPYIKSTIQQSGSYSKKLYCQVRYGGDLDNVAPENIPDVNRTFGPIFATTTPDISITYSYPISVNVGDVWKSVSDIYVNVGDVWKSLDELHVNVSDVWKKVFD